MYSRLSTLSLHLQIILVQSLKIVNIFLKHMNQCNVVFVKRSANTVAHLLARASCSYADLRRWRSIPPPFICEQLSLNYCFNVSKIGMVNNQLFII